MQLEDRDAEIAVVGMSCRLPGARDTAEFWKNLCAGVESISFFTDEERLGAVILLGPEPVTSSASSTRSLLDVIHDPSGHELDAS